MLVGLRGTFRSIRFKGTLVFTQTAGKHMLESGRYVPVHIIKLCLKYGKRVPDPHGKKGVFRYTIPILRENVQRLNKHAYKLIDETYKGASFSKLELEVVIQEVDNLILHFQYYHP